MTGGYEALRPSLKPIYFDTASSATDSTEPLAGKRHSYRCVRCDQTFATTKGNAN